MTNALITGLTEEEIERLRAWETEHSRELGYNEGQELGIERGSERRGYAAVAAVVSDGKYDEESACKLLDVPLEDYRKWKENPDYISSESSECTRG